MGPIHPIIKKQLKDKTEEAKHKIRSATKEERYVFLEARSRAKKKSISFFLTDDDFNLLVTRADGKCEDTGKKFETKTRSTGRYRDNWLSIDRIESNGPYSLDNCRLVTAAANYSKGDQSLQRIHIQRLLYYAKIGGHIDDKFLISREGKDPDKWKF